MTEKLVSPEELVADLRALGLRTNDRVVVHSSLRNLGRVPGGAEQVVECLRDVVGAAGLLVAPAFTYTSTRFDPATTPGRTGAFSEALRRHPDASRSLHPFYSVAAVGRGAEELVRDHEKLPGTAVGSPLDLLAQGGGSILLLGVSHVANTTVHVGEFRAEVDYLDIPFDPTWPTTSEVLAGRAGWQRFTYDHYPGCSRAFGVIEGALRRVGAVRDGRVGRAQAQLVTGADAICATVAILRKYPASLLCTDPLCHRCSRARRRLRTDVPDRAVEGDRAR